MNTKDNSDSKKGIETEEPLPADFEKKTKQRFEKLSKPEVTFDQFAASEKREFRRQKALEINAALKYKPVAGTKTPCGNGNFETGLDAAEWQGAYGSISTPLPAVNPFAGFTDGLFPGAGINDFNSHQTWVSAGTDPHVPIQTTAQGSAGAVRIGNAVNGYGCELLSKTFTVTQSSVTFWYAVVLQNPVGHPPGAQPSFWVRVTDAAGNIVPGAFDFGSGSDRLVADVNNPFFQSAVVGQETIVYKDWSCAQIDLSSQIGKQVTIEFVTMDCGYGGHWGYAYIDSFCGNCKGSPTGNITYNCEASSHCGPGKICFDYSLPTITKKGGVVTGSVTIKLNIYQNGTLLTTFSSPALGSGSSYCFDVKPASIPGIDPTLGGFDFTAVGAFSIGSPAVSLGSIKIGSAPDGVTPGRNNDYQIACKPCEEIEREQNDSLSKRCSQKVNSLARVSCNCPDAKPEKGDCKCDCAEVELPDIHPCISVSWGDSPCDCIETNDFEVLCVTVCNCYSNVTFKDLSIGRIRVTDMAGNAVAALPDGTPSVQIVPSGPVCFGDVAPCDGKNNPGCVSREFVLYSRGAVGKDYRLSFEGVCFGVTHHFHSEQCFVVTLCKD